jgi:N6-L-threonylcarbamoyladenine synthase
MRILGIETSCDECAAAIVEDGKIIRSNVVASQILQHAPYEGVVPEIASRLHLEWISGVVAEAFRQAGLGPADIDGVAATNRPGLLGSLLVGLNFAKGFAWARNLPFIAVDHMRAHLYAPQLAGELEYPFLGLLVSGGHSIIVKVDGFDELAVLGATIDDAVGEAFDKVAKHYGFGYPGGAAIDRLAVSGDPEAYRFPLPRLHKGDHRYDLSYSGLKTAVINQTEQFRRGEASPANLAASFQKAAIDILLRAVFRAVEDTGLSTLVAGGGVAANSYLRAAVAARADIRAHFPPLELCGDNGAMIAGLGFHYLSRGERSGWGVGANARVDGFKRRYP